MSSSRTKLVSARLTDAEFAAVERAAGADTISAWARTALVQAATPPPLVTPAKWNARGTRVEQGNTTQLPRCHDEARRDGAPPPNDHAAAARHDPAPDGTSRANWRANSTARWAWDPDLGTSRPWTRSAAWLPTIVILACLSAGGIAASQYTHASPDESWLDMALPALWGAVAVLMAGLVPTVADDIALALIRRAARPSRQRARGKWR
jgi:hypothetical protein